MQTLNAPGQVKTIKPNGRTAIVTVDVPSLTVNVGKEEKLAAGALNSHVSDRKWVSIIRKPTRKGGYSGL